MEFGPVRARPETQKQRDKHRAHVGTLATKETNRAQSGDRWKYPGKALQGCDILACSWGDVEDLALRRVWGRRACAIGELAVLETERRLVELEHGERGGASLVKGGRAWETAGLALSDCQDAARSAIAGDLPLSIIPQDRQVTSALGCWLSQQ